MIDTTNFAADTAQMTIDSLNALGQMVTNPYGFTSADIAFAQAKIDTAQQIYDSLSAMINTGNFSNLSNYIPSQAEITAGQTYWNGEA